MRHDADRDCAGESGGVRGIGFASVECVYYRRGWICTVQVPDLIKSHKSGSPRAKRRPIDGWDRSVMSTYADTCTYNKYPRVWIFREVRVCSKF